MRGSKKDLPKTMETSDFAMQGAEWGDMHVEFETAHKKMDNAPFLKGLPDDSCQCPHWGYVLKGRMRVKYKGHEEVINAGDAYYMPPGHTVVFEAGTDVVEFSPKDKLKKTMDVARRNFEAMQKKK
jgi:hypothetical protein